MVYRVAAQINIFVALVNEQNTGNEDSLSGLTSVTAD